MQVNEKKHDVLALCDHLIVEFTTKKCMAFFRNAMILYDFEHKAIKISILNFTRIYIYIYIYYRKSVFDYVSQVSIVMRFTFSEQ